MCIEPSYSLIKTEEPLKHVTITCKGAPFCDSTEAIEIEYEGQQISEKPVYRCCKCHRLWAEV